MKANNIVIISARYYKDLAITGKASIPQDVLDAASDLIQNQTETEEIVFREKLATFLRSQQPATFEVRETVETCRYCEGNCPNDEEYACDGYLGDIDGLYATTES